MYSKIGGLAGVIAVLAGGAFAQSAPGLDDAIAAAKNQLGVLEYCEAAGHIDGEAAAVQTRLSQMIGAAGDEALVEAAYQKGKEGVISAMGVEQTLADAAASQGSDEAALCGQLSSLVIEAGAAQPG